MQETWVRSLGREDPLEKEMAVHASILTWKIPWTEKRSPIAGHKESDMTERLTHTHTHTHTPVHRLSWDLDEIVSLLLLAFPGLEKEGSVSKPSAEVT